MLSHASFRPAAATFFKAMAGGLLALSALSFAQAAEQPPISLVVPFPPGGSTDIASRIIQPKLAELLDRNVVIENKPGAATQIASQYVQRAKPDGNTLLVSFDSHSLNPIVRPLPYDTFKDFRVITFALRVPLVVGVSMHVQANTLQEVVAAAKAEPEKDSYA